MEKLTPGINNKTLTIGGVAKESDWSLGFEILGDEDLKLYITLENNPILFEKILADNEYQESFGTKMLEARRKVILEESGYDIYNMVSPEALIYHIALTKGNPGRIMLFLISLLEWSYLNDKRVEPKDISEIFPSGHFYDEETCRNIIDHCMKPQKTHYSYIY